jgi:hypothetical protein
LADIELARMISRPPKGGGRMATTLDQTQPSGRDVRTLGTNRAAVELLRVWEGFANLGWRSWKFSAASARALFAANALTVISRVILAY